MYLVPGGGIIQTAWGCLSPAGFALTRSFYIAGAMFRTRSVILIRPPNSRHKKAPLVRGFYVSGARRRNNPNSLGLFVPCGLRADALVLHCWRNVSNQVGDSHPAAELQAQKSPANARLLCVWCPEAESNHRHEDFQSSALPTELSGQICVLWREADKARIKPVAAL